MRSGVCVVVAAIISGKPQGFQGEGGAHAALGGKLQSFEAFSKVGGLLKKLP
jgi:hypothetical protein